MIEVCCCVVHILAASAILASTHQLIVHASSTATGCTTSATAAATTTLVANFSLLLDNCHSVEIILSKIEVLTCLIFHLLPLQFQWQLLYFEIVHIVFLMGHTALMNRSLGLSSRLTMIITSYWYLRVTLIGRHLLVIHVQCVHILRVLIHELILTLS